MASAFGTKVTEYQIATSVGLSDILYLIQGGVSKQVTVQNLLNAMPSQTISSTDNLSREISLVWPYSPDYILVGSSAKAFSRHDPTTVVTFGGCAFSAGTVNAGYGESTAIWKGNRCSSFKSIGGGFGRKIDFTRKPLFRTGKVISNNIVAFQQAFRAGTTMAYDTTAGSTKVDFGVILAPLDFSANMFNTGLGVGVYFGMLADGTLRLQARQVQGAAVTYDSGDLKPVGFDPTEFHLYELRYGNATATEDAWVEAWLDGALVGTRRHWGVGSTLPDLTDPLSSWYTGVMQYSDGPTDWTTYLLDMHYTESSNSASL